MFKAFMNRDTAKRFVLKDKVDWTFSPLLGPCEFMGYPVEFRQEIEPGMVYIIDGEQFQMVSV